MDATISADIQALAVDSSASTLNQGVSKACYIFLEADGLGSSECVWAQAMEYLAGADALYAGSSSWPFFCGHKMRDFLWHARGRSPRSGVSAPWSNPASAMLTSALLKRA